MAEENNPRDTTNDKPKDATKPAESIAFSARKVLLNPAVLTVVLTAVIGPYIANRINMNIKYREQETFMMQEVLAAIKEAEFDQAKSINKMKIITKMVDENELVFNLNFDETLAEMQTLYDSLRFGTVTNLQLDLNGRTMEIYELTAELGDTDKEVEQLETQIAEKERERENSDSQKEQLSDEIKELEGKKANLEASAKNNERATKLLKELNTKTQEELDKKNSLLVEIREANYKNEEELTNLESNLDSAKNSIVEMTKLVKRYELIITDQTNNINSLYSTVEDLNELNKRLVDSIQYLHYHPPDSLEIVNASSTTENEES